MPFFLRPNKSKSTLVKKSQSRPILRKLSYNILEKFFGADLISI